MKRIWKSLSLAIFAVFVLAACGKGGNEGVTSTEQESESNSDEVLQVVTTFTLLEDMVSQIGGDKVTIYNLVPTGTDPHEYEPLPKDQKAATDADVFFYNGLNLEGGDDGWFAKLVDSVNQPDEVVFELGAGVEPMYLTSSMGEKEVNPHSFLDPVVGIKMAENTRDALIQIDPENKEFYEENAEEYVTTLREIDEEYAEKIAEIPEENRVLVTSERAYQYMADRYGLEEGYIWAVDTEEGGTPEQITSLIQFVNEKKPPVLFVESNVDRRPMETVSRETGIDIYAEDLFSDEIGKRGEEGDTYVKFLKYNIEIIYAGLTQ